LRPDLRIAREHYGGHRRAFLGSNAVFGFGVAEYFAGRQHFRECTSIFAIEESRDRCIRAGTCKAKAAGQVHHLSVKTTDRACEFRKPSYP